MAGEVCWWEEVASKARWGMTRKSEKSQVSGEERAEQLSAL